MLFYCTIHLIAGSAARIQFDSCTHGADISTVFGQVVDIATQVVIPTIVGSKLPAICRYASTSDGVAGILLVPCHLLCVIASIPSVEVAHQVHVADLHTFNGSISHIDSQEINRRIVAIDIGIATSTVVQERRNRSEV